MNGTTYFSHGKLLITGEYAVLDGAKALALPTKYGQHLHFHPQPGSNCLLWESFTDKGQLWFSASWELNSMKVTVGQGLPETNVLTSLLNSMMSEKGLPASFFEGKIETRLDFPREWGLGTSSTLIALLSKWTQINPYYLLEKSFGGSGYDIAAADASGPITYRRMKENNEKPEVNIAPFNPSFLNKIYFLYSGKKKNSREAISTYRSKSLNPAYISEISQLTERVLTAEHFSDFCALIKTHEEITGNQLDLTPVQEEYFTDFQGVVKSLGAWGGDFLMILTELPQSDIISYFKKKGFSTLFAYHELIFSENN